MNDLVLTPEDLPRVESVPLEERDLPASTYELLCRTAAAMPDKPALHLLGEGPERTWTYAELLHRVHQAANHYLSLGLEPGKGTVGLKLRNSGKAYAALLGAQAVGIANPVNPSLAPEHVDHIFALTGAEIVVTDESDFSAQPGDRLLTGHRPEPGDLAAYFHTGGTTGTPKVAPHTHAMEVYMAWVLGCSGAYAGGDAVALAGLPLFHVNAVHVTGLAPFMHGGTVVSLGPLGYRDRALMAGFWRIVERFRVTAFSAVPTVYSSLPPVPEGVDISSLRAGAVGAAPLPSTVRDGFERSARVPMLEGYGLTEATCVSAATPAFAPRPGSVGLRLPYQRIRATPEGELEISGPAVFPGYLGPDGPDPAGKIVDGWLRTGDLGHVDADGYVYLTGRAKDLIIRGGHNLDPRPIEESLLAHPGVTGAAVVGRPDAHAGEVPVAYVTVGAAVAEDELLAWAAARAPEPAAAPKAVFVVPTLPTTAVGKPYKPELVADSVRRLFPGVEVLLEDGRPVALIGDDPGLAATLDRHQIRHRSTS
ncbi:AMP-binding protein [Nonomuraea soli]|uniref:Fatty-acyl-CoA synthase n=1 Tax=Nonomuraea soli TaxID=1032476 RepID=A0A7W0CSH6_9ACTN|nr:AMP-binding protein [Nonomuraea soli]MBA2896491.1 fatty-acyl-CoA synthase [Nonomuraea soli]